MVKIYITFFKDSPEIRGLEKFKAETEIEVKRIEKEILDLKTKKLEADKSGDKEAGAKLDKLIFEKEKFLKEYRNIKNEEYKLRLQKMTSGQSDFILQVAEAIQFVAISEGYSIILEKQNPIFLFYSIEVDITDKVIEYLQNKRKTD